MLLKLHLNNQLISTKHQRHIWCKKTDVIHKYSDDIRVILSRKIPDDQQRSELEIEVLYKWILEVHDHDPTGIGNYCELFIQVLCWND